MLSRNHTNFKGTRKPPSGPEDCQKRGMATNEPSDGGKRRFTARNASAPLHVGRAWAGPMYESHVIRRELR